MIPRRLFSKYLMSLAMSLHVRNALTLSNHVSTVEKTHNFRDCISVQNQSTFIPIAGKIIYNLYPTRRVNSNLIFSKPFTALNLPTSVIKPVIVCKLTWFTVLIFNKSCHCWKLFEILELLLSQISETAEEIQGCWETGRSLLRRFW